LKSYDRFAFAIKKKIVENNYVCLVLIFDKYFYYKIINVLCSQCTIDLTKGDFISGPATEKLYSLFEEETETEQKAKT